MILEPRNANRSIFDLTQKPKGFSGASLPTRSIIRTLSAVVGLVALSSVAQAQVIVQTATFASVANFNNLALTPDINRFDPSLGTLLSIQIEFETTITSNVSTTLIAASSPPVSAQATIFGSPFSFTRLDNPSIPGFGSNLLNPTITTFNSSTVSLNVGQTTNYGGPLVTNAAASTTLSSAAQRTFFTEPGGPITFTTDASIVVSVNNTGSGTATFQNTITNNVSGFVRVTYFYSLPEPGTFALFGMGAIGLVAIRRRKNG